MLAVVLGECTGGLPLEQVAYGCEIGGVLIFMGLGLKERTLPHHGHLEDW